MQDRMCRIVCAGSYVQDRMCRIVCAGSYVQDRMYMLLVTNGIFIAQVDIF